MRLASGEISTRIIGDKGRLHEVCLDVLVVAQCHQVAPALLALFDLEALGLNGLQCLFRRQRHKVDAGVLLDSLSHRHALPALGEIDLHALIHHLGAAQNLFADMDYHVLGNIHHAVVIGVRLIQLKQRKFRIVARINALVAENAADFIYLIKAADNQPLEVQLQRNAHIHIDIKRVVMRDKRRAAAPPAIACSTGVSTSM